MVRYQLKLALILLFALGAAHFSVQDYKETIDSEPNQKSANFEEKQLEYIRKVIHTAGTKYAANYEMVSLYLQMQINETFPSFWNIAVYRKQDQNTSFYLTGLPDNTRSNKRLYQVWNPQNFGFSVIILETNNTSINSTKKQASITMKSQMQNLRSQSKSLSLPKLYGSNLEKLPNFKGLQFTKKKSQSVTTAQEAGIDLAMTTAYTWNKNIIEFTKVVQKLTETNLNQHWQVATRFQNLSNFGFLYTSPYDEWVEYTGYGLGSYVLHVYLYRNYING